MAATLVFSVLFNIGIFLYARAVVVRLLSVSEELGDLQEMVNSFANHLSAVYELETFYGDATLQGLLNHAISFNEQLETFEQIYTLTEKERTHDTKEAESEAT
jgi:hypothetical protein